jgi:hypothetical protein
VLPARVGRPSLSWRPAASVTDTDVKRGSTGSLNVNVTAVGIVFTTPLADGVVRTSVA